MTSKRTCRAAYAKPLFRHVCTHDLMVLSIGRSHMSHGMSRCVLFSSKQPSNVASNAACCKSESEKGRFSFLKYQSRYGTYERTTSRPPEARSSRSTDTVAHLSSRCRSARTGSSRKTDRGRLQLIFVGILLNLNLTRSQNLKKLSPENKANTVKVSNLVFMLQSV